MIPARPPDYPRAARPAPAVLISLSLLALAAAPAAAAGRTHASPAPTVVTDALTPGRHTLRFAIEGMRPKDEKGNYGYWRVSAALVGWDRPPRLWRNP